MRILSTGFTLLVLNLAGIACAHAEARQMPWEQTPPPRLLEDRLRVDVSLWHMGASTSLRADQTTAQPGTILNGESDLGLSDGGLRPDIELTLLPGNRHIVRINGFTSRRDGSAVLNRTVRFDDEIYLVGQTVKSTLNLDMLGIGYAYRLIKAPRYELAIGLDAQITAVEANVYVPITGAREADEGVVPLPLLDVEGRWEVLPKWQLQARYRWVSANVDDVDGSVSDWRAGVQWQFHQHLAVGLHYRSFNIDINSTSRSHPGALRLDYKGVQLGVRASM